MSDRSVRLQRWLVRLEDGLLALLLFGLVMLASAQVLQRWLFGDGWRGAEAVSETLVLWLAALGALAATRERRQVAIDALPRLFGPRGRRFAWCVGQLFAAVFCAAVAWFALDLVAMEREAPSLLFAGIPSWAPMLVLPFAFGLMALRFAIAAFAAPSFTDDA